jgi:hypothetical protein
MKLQKKHILTGLAAAIGIYFLISAVYNYLLSEEQKVKNLFYSMASDIESRSVLGFGAYFTGDAKVRYYALEMDAKQIGPFLSARLRDYEKVSISFSELSVEFKDNEAVVTFGGDARDVKRGSVGSFEGTARLRREDGNWKVYDATGRQQRKSKLVF